MYLTNQQYLFEHVEWLLANGIASGSGTLSTDARTGIWNEI